MSKTSLLITGLQTEMTSKEVKQKLAKLYFLPEENFKGVYSSVVTRNEPYVLLKQFDRSDVDAHVKRLTKLGFACRAGDGGLELNPVANTTSAGIICPACDLPSASDEKCDQCGVIIHKYLKQKEFDDNLRIQLNASSYSEERFRASHDEKAKKQKATKLARKIGKGDANGNNDSSTDSTGSTLDGSIPKETIQVHSHKKTSKPVYAVVATVCLMIAGAGFVAHEYSDEGYTGDGFLAKLKAESSGASESSGTSTLGMEESGSVQALEEEATQIVLAQQTIFDDQLHHRRKLERLENDLTRMHEEGWVYSSARLISNKEDPRERLFGNQALIKLEGYSQDTLEKLHASQASISGLERDVDRVEALLTQSSICNHFGLSEMAAKDYEQAARIAFDIENPEERILAEIAIAEHQLQHGDLESSQQRYQIAKGHGSDLDQSSLTDAAYRYISMSEANHGLITEARLTGENILNSDIRASSLRSIDVIVRNLQELELSGEPGLEPKPAAALEASNGDFPELDELTEMAEQNKRRFKAASQLLGR